MMAVILRRMKIEDCSTYFLGFSVHTPQHQTGPLRPQVEPLRQQTTDNRSGPSDPKSGFLHCKSDKDKSSFSAPEAFGLKQVMRGHDIIVDRWAGASNPHPYPNPTPTLKHPQKVSKSCFSHFSTITMMDGQMDRRTDRRMDGQTD